MNDKLYAYVSKILTEEYGIKNNEFTDLILNDDELVKKLSYCTEDFIAREVRKTVKVILKYTTNIYI